MYKYQASYQKVEALRKKHPEWPNTKLCEAAKVDLSSYYKGKRSSVAGETPSVKYVKRKHKVLSAPAPSQVGISTQDGRMVFLMGTPDQIRSVLAGGAI